MTEERVCFASLLETSGVRVTRSAPCARLLLHCRPESAESVAAATGLSLPAAMLRSASVNGWDALHLAPDEWLLIGAEENSAALAAAAADAARATPLSLVDVSDRSLGLELAGSGVESLLNAGCPLDLSRRTFPPGACSRTIFGKVTVMLWRRESGFQLEYLRSYDGYVAALLSKAAE